MYVWAIAATHIWFDLHGRYYAHDRNEQPRRKKTHMRRPSNLSGSTAEAYATRRYNNVSFGVNSPERIYGGQNWTECLSNKQYSSASRT